MTAWSYELWMVHYPLLNIFYRYPSYEQHVPSATRNISTLIGIRQHSVTGLFRFTAHAPTRNTTSSNVLYQRPCRLQMHLLAWLLSAIRATVGGKYRLFPERPDLGRVGMYRPVGLLCLLFGPHTAWVPLTGWALWNRLSRLVMTCLYDIPLHCPVSTGSVEPKDLRPCKVHNIAPKDIINSLHIYL